jgi:hypothetical protein
MPSRGQESERARSRVEGVTRWIVGALRGIHLLARRDRVLLTQAAVALPVITLGLRWMRISELLKRLGWLAGERERRLRSEGVRASIERTQRAVELAARHGLCRGSCLSRSATLWWLLRRQGITSDLRFGVRKEGDALEAHAWIECDGVVVNDRRETLARYVPFSGSVSP